MSGFQGDEWHPEETVTRGAALKMLTSAPAYASFNEAHLGTLEPGKLADISILSLDIMTAAEEEIPRAQCLMTIVDGEVEFDSGELHVERS